MSTAPLDIATGLLNRGIRPIPVPYRTKIPTITGWPKLWIARQELPQYFNGKPMNVGGLMGEASGWIVDAEMDHPLALELADKFLPHTPCTFGRKSNPKSHRLYRVTSPISTKPWKRGRKELFSLRSTGAQSIMPGSVHESGELIQWDDDAAEPATVDPDVLMEALDSLADAVRAKLPKKTGKKKRGKLSASSPPNVSELSEAISPITLNTPITPKTLITPITLKHLSVDEIVLQNQPQDEGERNACIHTIARALKFNVNEKPSLAVCKGIMRRWHSMALPTIRTKDFDVSWSDFTHAYKTAKYPVGLKLVDVAADRADPDNLPACAGEYGVKVKQIISLCWELSKLNKGKRFFISSWDLASRVGIPQMTCWRYLAMLQSDGVIKCVSRGNRNMANRYKWTGGKE